MAAGSRQGTPSGASDALVGMPLSTCNASLGLILAVAGINTGRRVEGLWGGGGGVSVGRGRVRDMVAEAGVIRSCDGSLLRMPHGIAWPIFRVPTETGQPGK